MPSKWTLNQEVCFPCKWHHNHLYIASRTKSVYHRYCAHPANVTSELPGMGRGRFIGTTEIRPAWCPIVGNPEAEKDAEADE